MEVTIYLVGPEWDVSSLGVSKTSRNNIEKRLGTPEIELEAVEEWKCPRPLHLVPILKKLSSGSIEATPTFGPIRGVARPL